MANFPRMAMFIQLFAVQFLCILPPAFFNSNCLCWTGFSSCSGALRDAPPGDSRYACCCSVPVAQTVADVGQRSCCTKSANGQSPEPCDHKKWDDQNFDSGVSDSGVSDSGVSDSGVSDGGVSDGGVSWVRTVADPAGGKCCCETKPDLPLAIHAKDAVNGPDGAVIDCFYPVYLFPVSIRFDRMFFSQLSNYRAAFSHNQWQAILGVWLK